MELEIKDRTMDPSVGLDKTYVTEMGLKSLHSVGLALFCDRRDDGTPREGNCSCDFKRVSHDTQPSTIKKQK